MPDVSCEFVTNTIKYKFGIKLFICVGSCSLNYNAYEVLMSQNLI